MCVFSVKVVRYPLKLTPERCDTHDDRTKRIQKQIPKRKPRKKQVILFIKAPRSAHKPPGGAGDEKAYEI